MTQELSRRIRKTDDELTSGRIAACHDVSANKLLRSLMREGGKACAVACSYAVLITLAACGHTASTATTDAILDLEQRRLRALVEADSAVIEALHAPDFELINPDGEQYSRDEYLGEIESGVLDYVVWQPGMIRVRAYSGVAIARYRDDGFEVHVGGEVVARGRYRHTNIYEQRDGRWQTVWSQASGIGS